MKVKALKGSLTVEAAVILPLLFGVFFSLLILAFYLHDRVVLQSHCYEQMFAKEFPSLVREADLLFLQVLNISGTETTYKKNIFFEAKLPLLSNLLSYFVDSREAIYESYTWEYVHPTESIREEMYIIDRGKHEY